MKYSLIAAALLISGAVTMPVAQADDPSTTAPVDGLPTDAYDATPDAPNYNAPINDVADPLTSTYTQSAAQTAAATAVAAAIADNVSTVVDAAATLAPVKRDISKRGTCKPYTAGNGPSVKTPDDSVDSWYANPTIAGTAALAKAPAGYVLADGFVNLDASTSSSTYLTYISDELTAYDPSECAAKCDSISGCASFNICKPVLQPCR